MNVREESLAHYRAERTIDRRNAVVNAHRHLCVRGAKKFKRPHNDRADLEQVAAVGLVKAAANYRSEMTTPFHVYAWIMIVGELMHYVRDYERIVRPPRALRSLEKRYCELWDRYTFEQHREPTARESAAALGVELAAVAEVRALRRPAHTSLPEPNSTESAERVDLLADAAPALAIDERLTLSIALDELGARERTIVIGTYGAGLTQEELGRRLGLSQSHVSKLLSRALQRLGQRVA